MILLELEHPLKTAAPGQYLGYSLQQLRLCHYLFKTPDGDAVSLEYLDDIAIHRSDGSVLLEQCKSALKGNPAANRSIELWKTFANWSELCVSKEINLSNTEFRLYITPAKIGDLVGQLHSAIDKKTIDSLLIKIGKLIDPKKPLSGCGPHVNRFLSAGDSICRSIIQNFQLTTEYDPVESVREYVRVGVPVDALENLTSAAVGMAIDRVNKLIRNGEKAVVSAEKFRREFRTFARRSNLANFLISKAPAPATAIVEEVVVQAPIFVRQLQAVEASEDMLVTAVSDYLRATADKVHWADEGIIVEDSLADLDAQLVRQHAIIREEIEDQEAGLNEAVRGRMLYRRCAATEMPLDGRSLPSHFIAGTYNYLADIQRLGWHPHFLKLLSEE